jgi:hypothetical protein
MTDRVMAMMVADAEKRPPVTSGIAPRQAPGKKFGLLFGGRKAVS